jgi:hypothetical protein
VLSVVTPVVCGVAGAQVRPREDPQPGPALQLWSVDLTVSGIYDSNPDRDEEDEQGTGGLLAGFAVGRQNRATRPSLQGQYAVTARTYSHSARWNRVSHRLRADYERRVAKRWSAGAAAFISLNVPTPEFPRADQLVFIPSLEFQPSRLHRARIYLALRERWYRDSLRSSAFSPYGGIDYRLRLGPWHYGDLWYRLERNNAELAAYRFVRSSWGIDYTRPLTVRQRVRVGLIHRSDHYDQPFDLGTLRIDQTYERWILSGSWMRDVDRVWRLQADYRFLSGRPSGPEPDFESHRFAGTIRYHWGAR